MQKAEHSESRSFSELAIEGRLEASPHALLLFLFRPVPSLVRLMLSHGYIARPSAERVVVRRCILFLAEANHRQRNGHREGKEFFHIRGRIFRFSGNFAQPRGRLPVK